MKSVLITGAGGGIGRALVEVFANAGWQVHASERRGPGLQLDVTNDESVRLAKEQIGVPDVIINNAGLGLLAPMAETSDELITRQFEVNVRGLARVTRTFVPEMIRRGHGRVINVGSLAGTFTLPWFGSYAATKHAVEAMTDALRLECAPFGVKVSLIEPSVVGTGFVDTAIDSLQRAADGSAWSAPLLEGVRQRSTFSLVQITPQQVAEVIFRAATARSPQARYRVGKLASVMLRLLSLVPTRLADALLRSVTGLTPPSRSLPPPAEESHA
ncbi:MAG: SDR family oxidoreductase [Archangiaceae bacterium]|nr:SDR family oxidoreductase [Archangiaceae bacterium]